MHHLTELMRQAKQHPKHRLYSDQLCKGIKYVTDGYESDGVDYEDEKEEVTVEISGSSNINL